MAMEFWDNEVLLLCNHGAGSKSSPQLRLRFGSYLARTVSLLKA